MKNEVSYLGYLVIKDGVKPNREKIKAVEFPSPKNSSEVKIILGLAWYYRIFILIFAEIVKPLTLLLKKDVKLDSNDYFR